MTTIIDARNVNDAFPEAMRRVAFHADPKPSRNGTTFEFPDVLVTTYEHPWERVLFDPVRDANPFFHLMEGIWMLAGRDDVAWISQFNDRMKTFSDDGLTLRGAYGARWQDHDQLAGVIELLRVDPMTRRAVLQMWQVERDLLYAKNGGKDVPCNLDIVFSLRRGVLDMTIFCRSNDLIWGCYGANVVHFSMLMEFVAGTLGVKMGRYIQISVNAHVYVDLYSKIGGGAQPLKPLNLYTLVEEPNLPVVAWPMFDNDDRGGDYFLAACQEFCNVDYEELFHGRTYRWLTTIAWPMRRAWNAYHTDGSKHDRVKSALAMLEPMPAMSDWRYAAARWLDRRMP